MYDTHNVLHHYHHARVVHNISKTKNKNVQNKAITGLGSRPKIRQERTQKPNLLITSTNTQRTDDSLRRQRAPHQRTHRPKHWRNQCQRCRLSMSRRLGWQVSSHGTGTIAIAPSLPFRDFLKMPKMMTAVQHTTMTMTMRVKLTPPFSHKTALALEATGALVGEAVGDAVGSNVGVAVGDAVGLAVGDAVGIAVGAAVGIGVGKAVGCAVGMAVGEAVGEAVGIAVGYRVGSAVGCAVGEVVGVAVGAWSLRPACHARQPYNVATVCQTHARVLRGTYTQCGPKLGPHIGSTISR